MKKVTFYILVVIFLTACGGTQKTTNYIQSGNYVEAFNNSIAKLTKDKTSKSSQKHVPLLKEAFQKAATQNLNEIASLKGQNTPKALKKIYGNYLNLDLRQDEVRVLQPLYYEGKEVTFDYKDYTNDLKKSKEKYSALLYDSAMKEMKGGTQGARNAYKLLGELIYVNPTYKNNLNELSQKAKKQGSSFIFVSFKNKVKQIHRDSVKDFARINSGGFDNPWLIFHHKKDRKVKYDYQVDINLNKLTFTQPEVKQQKIPQERKVQDGFKYRLDSRGNVMKDDKGNDIKDPNYKVVRAEVVLFQQNKTSKLDGNINIKNLKTKQTVSNTPMFGEAKFQNTYGKFRGDQRAIDQKYYKALQAKEVAYPKDYQFVKYSIMNFKQKVKQMLAQQKF